MHSSDSLLPFSKAAKYWHTFGFAVIPIIPGTKLPAVKWDPWLAALSPEAISTYWAKHPDHEVGLIVGDDLIVIDSDTPEAVSELAELEKIFDITPCLTVTTAKGQHHYFRRGKGTFAKSDSHSSEEHPDRIDVKTGRSLVVLPPSTGKKIGIDEVEDVGDLSEVNQEFIDAVCIHNGRVAPRPPSSRPPPSPRLATEDMDQTSAQLNAMLQYVDPDLGYDDWLHVLMAIFHETGGSDQGLAVAIAWSSRGDKYAGEGEIKNKWQSFGNFTGNPVTVGTIHKMPASKGVDWIDVCASLEPDFEPCEYTIIHPNEQPLVAPAGTNHPLARYSLTGKLHQLEQEVDEQVLILGELALMGQITVIYAAPNTGKTLLTLWMLIAAIKFGNLNPSKVFYINVDDSLLGVITKLRLAEKYGFQMIAEGHRHFRADDLLSILTDQTNKDQSKGVVLILDTLKKFTDIMCKHESTTFSKAIRKFVMQGGTCIALAHVTSTQTGVASRFMRAPPIS
jgi:hypothetical protein